MPAAPAASGTRARSPSVAGLAGRAGSVDHAGVEDVGRVRSPELLRASRRILVLSWASLVWMIGEGTLGLVAGVQGGSLSLVGWALGSVIEGLASAVVIWRFTGSRARSETAEARAQKAAAVSFFLLAPYLVVQAVRDLVTGHAAEASLLGLLVTAASVVVMPALGLAKHRLGRQVGSRATVGEGTQNLMCAVQAAAVLVGLALTATVGWRWVDPAVALALAVWAVREGQEAWEGEEDED